MFHITLPTPVKLYLASMYLEGSSIVEYGMGGSTLLALRSGLDVISVETDNNYISKVQSAIKSSDIPSYGASLFPILCDIGPTTDFGNPDLTYEMSPQRIQSFSSYASSPWNFCSKSSIKPSFVLIDGRFRVSISLFSSTSSSAGSLKSWSIENAKWEKYTAMGKTKKIRAHAYIIR